MNKLDRTYEFAKMYYEWVCKCLVVDEKYEELAFFKLGIDLMIRQKELINIKYSQIYFPYVKDIQIMKIYPNMSTPMYYKPKEISRDTYDLLNKLWSKDKDKIFDKPVQTYVKSIKESIGDTNFDGCYMRNLGIKLKCTVKERL